MSNEPKRPEQPPMQAPASGELEQEDLDRVVGGVASQQDSLSELGEQTSLRARAAMERMSKSESAISSVQKKLSDVSSSVAQNMK